MRMHIVQRLTMTVGLALLLGGQGPAHGQEVEEAPAGRTVVVWISIDGFRADYLERTDTPLFDRLLREGAYSRDLAPIFPSLTFPSHVSQATGVTADRHGVTGNRFFDAGTGQTWSFPPFARLMEAEPIWQTAARQGLRVASLDWPLSHAQEGEVRADYFGERYNPRLSDQERLDQLLDLWHEDDGEQPLRLIMGYAVATDSAGHRFGPDAPDMAESIAETDRVLQHFFDRMMAIWRQKMTEEDVLHLFITSDHGMSQVDWLVNPSLLLGVTEDEGVRIVTGGNVANVFVDQIEPEAQRQAMLARLQAALAEHDFARGWRRQELPETWGYNHPTRTGDLVVVLDPGHTFSRGARQVRVDVDDVGSPRGMHGYDPRADANMNALAVFWRYPRPLGGIDLGPIHSLQLHPTAARLLGIAPADGAEADPIDLEQPAAVPVTP